MTNAKNDVPASVIKEFAVELASPLANIINCSVKRGEYPEIWKLETATPVPKVYPPKKVTELRKISSLRKFSKIIAKIIGECTKATINKLVACFL